MTKFISGKILTAFLLVILVAFTQCNKDKGLSLKVMILKPGSEPGKDSNLWNLYPDQNGGDSTYLRADVGEIQGNPYIERSLFEFDVSFITEGSEVLLAELSLYYYDPDNREHHSSTGPNTAFIQKVTSSWTENTVTWNNQPSSTINGQAIILDLTAPKGDLIDLDVTEIVQEMVNNNAENFGFLLKLETEDGNKGIYFASSDHPNTDLHPKLIITYLE